MLLALQEQAAESRGWVSYNGKSFDLPLLATRLALARLAPLPAFRPHADLLHAVRVAYARHWPDCRLATAEARLLGRTRDNDLPGHAVPAAWTAFLREGDLRALPGLLLHNRLDLVSLAELLPGLGTRVPVATALIGEPAKLGGPSRLSTKPEPIDWSAVALWVVLIAGVILLGIMAWKLAQDVKA